MNTIIFGFGEVGKKLVDECLTYECDAEIVAIVDNYIDITSYKNIPIIKPFQITEYEYDEIWVSTVYYVEIKDQLLDMGIDCDAIRFVEPVVPILEYQIKKSGDFTSSEYESETEYIRKNHLRMYCYDFYDEYLFKDTEIVYDENVKLFYGFYNNHKMYLARRYNTKQKARSYFNAVIMEQDCRSPHCYFNDPVMNNQKGKVIDIGAAEGIFGLQIIDNIDHLYMIEVDEEWIEALHYTFEDYKDKVTIISKFIGRIDEGNIATIDHLFADETISSIKMDIEGAEMDALLGAAVLINRCKPDLAICVYHHKNDNEVITDWCLKAGYQTHNSDGVVVCQGDWELTADEVGFRRALLFAQRK